MGWLVLNVLLFLYHDWIYVHVLEIIYLGLLHNWTQKAGHVYEAFFCWFDPFLKEYLNTHYNGSHATSYHL